MSADATAMPATDAVLAGLHSPPDSNSARKDGSSDSELSDLEPDHETNELLNVQPEYISEGNVPVFRPTMEQFKDFQKYVSTIAYYPRYAAFKGALANKSIAYCCQ